MSSIQVDAITFSDAATADLSGNEESDVIKGTGWDELHFQIEQPNTGTPAGAWYLLERVPGCTNFTAVPIDKVQTPRGAAAGVTHTSGNTNIACSGNSGNGTAVIKFAIVGGAGEYKLEWVRSGGTGSATARVTKKAYA
jgi:hypothetical protein